MTDFQLTPAEAALLLKPRRGSAASCLQCALLALLAKGHLTLEPGGMFSDSRVRRGKGNGSPLAAHHRVVKDAVFAGSRDSATASEVSSSLRKAFGSDHARYVHDHVAPLLIERDLLQRSSRRWLGLIPYIHYEHSAQGH